MAVYTTVEQKEIEQFIEPFGIGPLVNAEGVAAGTQNTNYFITTDQSSFASELHTQPLRHFVLTIFEHVEIEDLTFYIKLTRLLSVRGLPVPCPITDADGIALHYLDGKPALLIPKIEGQTPQQPNSAQCEVMGRTLAQIHKICLNEKFEHHASTGLNWLKCCANELKPLLDDADRHLLKEIPRFLQLTNQHSNLLQGVIHNDLFRENAIFQGDDLVGIINFTNAGSGFLMMDLAITVNDWCSKADGSLDDSLLNALLCGYQDVRSLTNDEQCLWNDFLRIAAVHVWVSRVHMQLLPESCDRPGGLIAPKNPLHYKNILLQRTHHLHTIS